MTHLPSASLPGERLALLARLAQQFSSSLDLDEVLNRVMDEVIAAVRAERGFVMLRDTKGALSFMVARGLDQRTIEEPGFQVSRGVIERVATDGQPILSSDAQQDDRFSMRQSIVSLGLRSILCAPLIVRDQITGVIYVDSRLRAGIFTPADLELLTAIAASAAIALENARLYQTAIEKGRLERELQMARDLQCGLLPQELPLLPGWEFAARWQPAREVAGDFYDFVNAREGRVGLLVADVADKGIAAAIFMALARSIIRASLANTASPADGIAAANRLICQDATGGMFVTLFYVEVDASGRLTYVNAGHNPAILSDGQRGSCVELAGTGPLLGVDDLACYRQETLQLAPGDFVLLYTDGVTEAICGFAPGDSFGEQRLRESVQAQHALSACAVLDALSQTLKEFMGTAPPFDDVTMVGIKRLA